MVSSETSIGFQISVIVPCFNQGQFLAEALDSVLNQTYPKWECIIVNDGSTDDTANVAQHYLQKDNRFKYLYKENGGLSSARNAGIKNTTGEYILPLDADDKIGLTYLEKAMFCFKSKTGVKLVYTRAKRFGLINEIWDLKEYSYSNLLIENNIYCSAIYKRSDYEVISGYDESMKNGYEDWEFWIRLLGSNDIVYCLPEVNFFYRTKPISSIYTNWSIEAQKRIYIFNKHKNKYLEHLPDPIILAQENRMLKSAYKDSFDYKLGNTIINPIRKLLKLLKPNG